jgi:4'-phosphopantetheinyl transferase EntD
MDMALLERHPDREAPGDAGGFARFGWHSWPSLGLTACQCHFSIARFDDGLFERLAIRPEPCLQGAVKKRRAEYLAGRLCASRALMRLGAPGQVTTAADRSAIWPAGRIGSITHSGETAMAVAVSTGVIRGVGIDIESRAACRNAALETRHFATEAERGVLERAGIWHENHAVLAFSVKESFFKAAYPQVGRHFGFSAVAIVEVDPVRRIVSLEIYQNLSETLTRGRRATGEFTDLRKAFLRTAVVI